MHCANSNDVSSSGSSEFLGVPRLENGSLGAPRNPPRNPRSSEEPVMRGRGTHATAGLLLLLLLLPAAHAQRPSDLDRIRTDISRLRARLEQVRTQAQSAARELEEVELELGIRTRELELASAA